MTHVFQKLLGMGRGAASQGRLMPVGCSNEESMMMADLVCSINSNLAGFQSSSLPSQIQKGVSRARSDDTKSMTQKGAGPGLGVDWSDPEYISFAVCQITLRRH
jgi:hypothetical protein